MNAHAAVGEDAAPGRRARIAWLLRVNRLLAEERPLRSLSAFAAAFHGGAYDRDVSASTVSRWETGRKPVPWPAVRRYEELLGLPRNLLTATARTVWRYWAPGPVLDVDPGGVPARPVEDLLEQAVSDDVMTGDDWDQLVDGLCARPDVVLMPSGTWSRLAERLVEEMVIADDLPWMLRFESLNRLLNHRRGGRTVIAVCGAMAAERARLTATEIVCALDNCGHPDAADLVLGELTQPSGLLAHRGAVMACFRKVNYRHFDEMQLRTLVRVVRDSTGAGPLGDQIEPLRRHLSTVHPEYAHMVLGRSGRATLPGRSAVRHTDVFAQDARAPMAVAVCRVAACLGAVESDRVCHPPVPTALINEALTSPLFDVRLYAAFLLAATPYRPVLADALAAELIRPMAVRQEELAIPLLEALRVLGDHRHRGLLQRLAVSPGVPRVVAYAAVRGLGHVAADHAAGAFLRDAVAHHHAAWLSDRDPTTAATLESLVYALGMASRDDLLTAIAAEPGSLPAARTAAAWWLSIPGHRRASALL
ncbi:helix-turn-helix domain-containing protein [Streptomyces actuosus]|uniref:Helix-turn-helix domain-containing protein n=1 Tax=Streptomyces actuosus TaxID=1885 RepID=A0ABS2VZH9_STRAS|nr:helix-turn-helix domain-containing protein [Streptomyces actuosus]MBN0048439.1 helix-turn-helix domain-containing protein [Streptomyces actuosus]